MVEHILMRLFPGAKIENRRHLKLLGEDWLVTLLNGLVLRIDDKFDHLFKVTGRVALDYGSEEVLGAALIPGIYLLYHNYPQNYSYALYSTDKFDWDKILKYVFTPWWKTTRRPDGSTYRTCAQIISEKYIREALIVEGKYNPPPLTYEEALRRSKESIQIPMNCPNCGGTSIVKAGIYVQCRGGHGVERSCGHLWDPKETLKADSIKIKDFFKA